MKSFKILIRKVDIQNLILLISSIYIPLIFSDLYIVSNSLNVLNRDAERIERERMINEDIPQREKAISQGYQSIKFPIYTREETDGINLYPIGTTPFTNHYYCNEGYGLVKYKSDRLGFRNNDEVWDKLKSDKYDQTIFIGDSFTHGACVKESDSITGNYKKLNNNKNIINLGMGGNSPYQYIASLNNIVKPIVFNLENNFDVIMIIFSNDNIDNINGELEKIYSSIPILDDINLNTNVKMSKPYQENFNEIYKKIDVPTGEEILKSFKMKHNYNILTKVTRTLRLRNLSSFIRVRTPFINKTWQRIRQKNNSGSFANSPSGISINKLSKICTAKCKPHVVFIPSSNFWKPSATQDFYKSEIIKYTNKLKINLIDASQVIDINSREDYAPAGVHLSKNGYKKVAKLISGSTKN